MIYVFSSNLFTYDINKDILVSDNTTICRPNQFGTPIEFDIKSEKTGIKRRYRFVTFIDDYFEKGQKVELYELYSDDDFSATATHGKIVLIKRLYFESDENS